MNSQLFRSKNQTGTITVRYRSRVNVAYVYDYARRCTEHGQGSFHFLSVPPTKEDFLKFHTPRNFTLRCSPSDIQILCDFRASKSNPSALRNITFIAILLLNPLDLFFVDVETLRIVTSFESHKEATPWIFPENCNMGTPPILIPFLGMGYR